MENIPTSAEHAPSEERLRELEAANQKLQETNSALMARVEELEKLAMKDKLTGLLNRRGVEEEAAALFALLKRERDPKGTGVEEKHKPACVLLLDIDNFKTVNDLHGHGIGDQILKTAASVLLESVREGDIVGRWGGEEFVIVFQNADAQDIINKFHGASGEGRATINFEVHIEGEPPQRISMSGGVTNLLPDEDINHAVDRADLSLYAAKGEGRNRIIQTPQENY